MAALRFSSTTNQMIPAIPDKHQIAGRSRRGFHVLLFVLLLSADGALGQAKTLRAGCARVDITCPIGTPLIGSYGKPSADVLDPLYARTLVLNDGSATLALVSADLLYTPLEEIVLPVRAKVREQVGIPEQNVLVCATHTHSGPEVFTRSKLPSGGRLPASQIDQVYLTSLIKKIADSVRVAHNNMQPARIGIAKDELPELVFNRRTIDANGMAVMTWRVSPKVAMTRTIRTDTAGQVRVSFALASEESNLEFGPVDPDLHVVRVEDMDGDLVGSLLNFACHPVCVYPFAGTTISADYPGDASGVVEQVAGGLCLFTLGTAGNIVPYQRGLAAHRQIGRALGGAALRQLQFVKTIDDVRLRALTKKVEFPVKVVSAQSGGDPGKETLQPITTEIQVLAIGDIYLLGLPGEVLVEIGLEIKRKAALDNLILISLSNDTIGYICHSRAYEQGGYEPGPATYLAQGAGEILTKETLGILAQITEGP